MKDIVRLAKCSSCEFKEYLTNAEVYVIRLKEGFSGDFHAIIEREFEYHKNYFGSFAIIELGR